MWKGVWENTILICGNHDDNLSNIMHLVNDKGSIMYICPRSSCDIGECICRNRLTVLEFDKMLEEMDKKSGDIFSSDSLEGYSWKKGKHSFQVLEENQGRFTVKVKKIK